MYNALHRNVGINSSNKSETRLQNHGELFCLHPPSCEKLPHGSSSLCISVQSSHTLLPFLYFLSIFYVVLNLGHKGNEIGDFVTTVGWKHSVASSF